MARPRRSDGDGSDGEDNLDLESEFVEQDQDLKLQVLADQAAWMRPPIGQRGGASDKAAVAA